MRPPARLAAFGGALAVVVGCGAGLGAAIGPLDVGADAEGAHDAAHEAAPAETTPADGGTHEGTAHQAGAATATDRPGGLAVAEGGYRLDVPVTTFAGGTPLTFDLRVLDAAGDPVTRFAVEHEKRLHLVVVGRDLVDYAHVHPTLAPDGTWTAAVPALPAGSYRAFADFRPAGGDALTLGVDLTVTGEAAPDALPEPSHHSDVDGYRVDLAGDVRAGTSELAFTVRRGADMVRTDPYLGAAGHLVAIREGDMAYLHVHPIEGDGHSVRFTAELPSPGRYRLFLDFAHDGAVHTAAFTVEVPMAGAPPAAADDHGGH